jgi:hypothetical protein
MHLKTRPHGLLFGLLAALALTLVCFSRASSLPSADSQGSVTINLAAPDFASDPAGGLRLALPETTAENTAARQPVYSTDVDEGQPVLPHRLVTLVLPPDADLDSLALEVEGAQVELAPGQFQVPLAEPKVLACAPIPADACAGTAADTPAALPGVQPATTALARLSSLLQQGTILQNIPPAPGPAVTLMPYAQVRKWKLARLDYQPFSYNPASGRLTVIRQVTARVTFRRDPALLDRTLLSDTAMDGMLPQEVDNFAEARPWYEDALASLGGPLTPDATNDYLVITTDAIYNNSNIGIYMQYLREHGHGVTAFTTSRYGGKTGQALAKAIRDELKQIYASWGLVNVLLVGDPATDGSGVPMAMMYPDRLTNPNPTTDSPQWQVPTDLYYANLTGNWDLNGNGYPGEAANAGMGWAGDFDAGGVSFAPTLHVGRIPVYNNDYATLDDILQKLMDYQNAVGRPLWRNNVILAHTFWGGNYDGAVLGHLINYNFLTHHASDGISAYRIYSNFPLPSTGTCTYSQVSTYPHEDHIGDQVLKNYWSTHPSGLMVWSGHGNINVTAMGFGNETVDCWHEYLFTSGQAAALDDTRPAFTYQNSCLNGYPERTDNLGYSLLVNGAVSTVSASRVTWLDSSGETEANLPTTYTSAANKGYQYVGRLMIGQTAGEALDWAAFQWPISAGTNAQNNFDFNLYGDPAMVYFVEPGHTLYAPSILDGQLTSAGGTFFFDLDWQDNNNFETYFMINLSPTDGTADKNVAVERNRITTKIGNLACGKTYDITMKAGNGGSLSSPSNLLTLAAQPCPPAAPASLTGYVGDYHVKLIWSNVSGETGYRILRRTIIGNYMTLPFEVGIVGANTTTFTDTSSVCYKKYMYTIVAFNSGGESSPSPSLTINSQQCAPPAPTFLAATPAQTSITLTWTDNSNGADNSEAGFEIWRIPPGGSWTVMAVVAPNTTSYVVDGLQCGDTTNIWYKVAAYNNGGRAESNQIPAQPAACTVPAAPTDLAVDDAGPYPDSVHLGWVDHSDNEWGFKIERLNAGIWELAATVDPDVTERQIKGLSCSGSYQFRVYAYNGAGNSSIDGPIPATTSACDPYVPPNFQGNGGLDGIALTWDWTAGIIPTGFEIQRASFIGRLFSWSTIANPAAKDRSYLDQDVACGVRYYYRIRAWLALGASAFTPAIQVQNVPCPPGAPGAISAQAVSSTSIMVSWRPPLEGGPAEGYNIDYKPDWMISLWTLAGTNPADELTFTVTHLLCGHSYNFRVSAFNAGGEGSHSSTVTRSTLECPPNAPSGLTRTSAALTSLTLGWTDNSSNEDGFILQRLDPVNGWTDVATTGIDVNSASESSLKCGTLYTYRVLAFNGSGESAPSPELQTATRLCEPAITAQAGVEGVVTLTWRDLTAFPVAHLVERQEVTGAWTPIGSVEAGTNRFVDLNAPCGAVQYYHVAGSSDVSDGPWSHPASVVTTCAPTTAITLTAGSPTAHSISLTWRATAGGQTGYVLERSGDGTLFWVDIATLDLKADSFVDTGLPAGRRFYYRLRAVNAGGTALSHVASAQTKYEVLLPAIRK